MVRNSLNSSLKTVVSLILAGQAWLYGSLQPAQALFFGYNQQAEAYKQQGDAAREAQNFGMAVNYYTSAINMLPYDAAQNLADLYYVRALANDMSGQYQRATSDWQSAQQNYLLCAQNGQGNPGVNVSYDQQMADELGRLVAWRNTENPNASDYMECGPMRRFPASHNPIKLYIDTSEADGFSYDLRYLITQAFEQWSNAGGSPIRFQSWDNMSDADIIVRRTTASGQIGFDAAGRTRYEDAVNAEGQDLISKTYVRLTATTYDGSSMSQSDKNKLYNLALHEAGHALGIGGHSPSGLDVMYWKSPLLRVSDRDINTLRRIYQ